jgi:hypothetical protein
MIWLLNRVMQDKDKDELRWQPQKKRFDKREAWGASLYLSFTGPGIAPLDLGRGGQFLIGVPLCSLRPLW